MTACKAVTRRGTPCKRAGHTLGYCHDHWPLGTACVDCGWLTMGGRDGTELYMVHDDLWHRAGMAVGRLCVACLEARIGRPLTADDFNGALCNQPDLRDTPRLADRKNRRPAQPEPTDIARMGH